MLWEGFNLNQLGLLGRVTRMLIELIQLTYDTLLGILETVQAHPALQEAVRSLANILNIVQDLYNGIMSRIL